MLNSKTEEIEMPDQRQISRGYSVDEAYKIAKFCSEK